MRQKMIPCIYPWLEVTREPTGPVLWFHTKCQKLILVCVWVCIFLCPSPLPHYSSSFQFCKRKYQDEHFCGGCSDLPKMWWCSPTYTATGASVPCMPQSPGLCPNPILLLLFARLPIFLSGSQIPQAGWTGWPAWPASSTKAEGKSQPRNCSHPSCRDEAACCGISINVTGSPST